MLTQSERFSPSSKMLRTLVAASNKTLLQQQVNLKLLYSIGTQNGIISRAASSKNPKNPQNLPSLPVPELQDTIKKFLRSVQPLLNENEFATTTKLFTTFGESRGIGTKLQRVLLDRAKKSLNWLDPWWINTAYLGFRSPVVVFSSPGQTFPALEFKSENDRLYYAAKLILAAASYKMLIDNKKIPVDKMGKEELDMNQYNKIFGTCRIPNMPLDGLEYHPKSKHIVVAHNNQFYKINLFSDEGKPLSETQLLAQLNRILLESQTAEEPVGVLSSDGRDNWAKAYKLLIEDPSNKKSAREIQTSLFLVCFDRPLAAKPKDNRRTTAGRQLLLGGGSVNAGNRWYDKTVQFVLGTDGIVGLTYEHSPAEGQPIAVMVDYLHEFIKKGLAKDIPNSDHNTEPLKLPFRVNKDLKPAIATARTNVDNLAENIDLNCFEFKNYGKDFVKSQKLSPDSFIQMAMQYAFYRMYNKPAAHYESAATRKYIDGRTETIRSCSIESVAFAQAMLDTKKTDADRAAALRAAINSHKKYTSEAVNGFGVDRHLLGLKLAAKELGLPVPEVYQDVGFVRSTQMRISSSQVATKCDGFMCYGPTEDNGYGCCYNPRVDTINFAICSMTSNADTDSSKFRSILEQCLVDMKKVLLNTQKAKI